MAAIRPRRRTKRVGDSATAAALLGPCFDGLAHEELRVLYLDGELRLLGRTGATGGLCAVDLPIRRLIGAALALGADAMVIAHNHPCGDPRPTRADRHATRRLAEAARALDIRIVDHLVFAARRWISFRAMGLL